VEETSPNNQSLHHLWTYTHTVTHGAHCLWKKLAVSEWEEVAEISFKKLTETRASEE